MPGGVSAVRTARDADATVVVAPMLPGGTRRRRRSAAARHCARTTRSTRGTAHRVSGAVLEQGHRPGRTSPARRERATRSDPQPGSGRCTMPEFDVSADGRFLVTTWPVAGPGPVQRSTLMRVDLASGERTIIADDPDADLENPAISPDGTAVAFTRETIATPDRAPRMTLQYLRFGEQPRSVAEDWDRRPSSLTWSSDGTALVVTADQNGRAPIFAVERVDVDGHSAHRRRLLLHRRRRRAGRRAVRAAQFLCGAATSGADRSRRRGHACCRASTCQRCQGH